MVSPSRQQLGMERRDANYLCHNVCVLVKDHLASLYDASSQTWGLEGRIVVWDETVLTCRRRYNRGEGL